MKTFLSSISLIKQGFAGFREKDQKSDEPQKKNENSLEEFIDSNFMINPLMRRSMIQSVRIIDEIEKI